MKWTISWKYINCQTDSRRNKKYKDSNSIEIKEVVLKIFKSKHHTQRVLQEKSNKLSRKRFFQYYENSSKELELEEILHSLAAIINPNKDSKRKDNYG